uniref:Putative secreted protein n=1 Tax=Ixodes ricinus TaxID=34613 RepID=A0A6B0UBJ0_IXORI
MLRDSLCVFLTCVLSARRWGLRESCEWFDVSQSLRLYGSDTVSTVVSPPYVGCLPVWAIHVLFTRLRPTSLYGFDLSPPLSLSQPRLCIICGHSFKLSL